MIKFTVDHCDSLETLRQAGPLPIDGLEFGPWYGLAETRTVLSHWPGMPAYFHPANLVSDLGLKPGAFKRLQAYLALTHSPWAAFHMVIEPPGCFWLAVKKGIYLPLISPEWLTRAFIAKIRKLSGQLAVPILLENLQSWPDPRWKYNFKIEPERIRRVLEATGAGLLLDLGHARIAAESLGMGAEDYLARLPLDRVRQIHTSGPRVREGHLHDLHQSLQAVDYALLEWALARTRPEVVTLEYIQEPDALNEQIQTLQGIIKSR